MACLIVLPLVQSGMYRISSLSPELYLELQSDNTLRATKLNKTSDGQKWEISPDQVCPGQSRSAWRDAFVTQERASAEPQRGIEVTLDNRSSRSCIRVSNSSPQAYVIDDSISDSSIANARDHRVLELVPNNTVGFAERDAIRGQRWILHPFKFDDDTLAKLAAMQLSSSPSVSATIANQQYADLQTELPPSKNIPTNTYQPTFKDGVSYAIRNHTSGRVIVVQNYMLKIWDYSDNRMAKSWTLKNQPDGGTAISCGGFWAAAELKTSTTEHSFRFFPAKPGGGKKFYYICPDMISDPPKVLQDDTQIWGLILADRNDTDESQTWELVPIM